MKGIIVAVMVSVAAVASTLDAARQAPGTGPRAFELRTYTAAPGKLEALSARFRDHIIPLFTKHKMTVVAFWVATDKPDTLMYMLSFPSRAAADASWTAFRADPEWVALQKEGQAQGPLTSKVESMFLAPTDYSPMK